MHWALVWAATSIAMIEIFRYRIPFVRSFEMAGQSLHEREGIVLKYTEAGHHIFSEIAPLPGFSSESLDEAIRDLARVLHDVRVQIDSSASLHDWSDWLRGAGLASSIRFGLDTLYRQTQAARLGVPFHRYLNPNSHDMIATNAVVGILPPTELEARTVELVQAGFTTIKYKVHDPSECLSSWVGIRSQFPELNMRFDANASWDSTHGHTWAKHLEAVRPQYLEQPFAVGSERETADLQLDISYPIAYDESARDLSSVMSILERSSNPVIILKPMLLGSVDEMAGIIAKIREYGAKFTITTLIESGIGRRLTAALASAFGDPGIAHGLGTGALFLEDVLADDPAPAGTYRIGSDILSSGNSYERIHINLLTKLELD